LHNHPDRGHTSRLSAYLHFGQISHLAVTRVVIDGRAGDAPCEAPKGKAVIGRGLAVTNEPLQSLLDELVTQRELAINFCLREPVYDTWEGLPDWGQRTLLEHLGDARPAIYSPADMES
jgi:deoxyribodipyrimidine photo-lyase